MCVAVPTGYRSAARFLELASRWVNTAMSLPVPMASSIRRTELSPCHGQWHERIREQDRIAQREDRKLGRNRQRLLAGHQVLERRLFGDRPSSSLISGGTRRQRPNQRSRKTGNRGAGSGPRGRQPAGRMPQLAGDVKEERRGPLGHQPLAMDRVLARLLAVLAPDRKRQGPQPRLGDLLAALEADAVRPFFQPRPAPR